MWSVDEVLYGARLHRRGSPLAGEGLFAAPCGPQAGHSLMQFESNFALSFPFWDVLFATAYFPKRSEYPRTGLADVPEPRSVGEYLFSPIMSQRERSRSS